MKAVRVTLYAFLSLVLSLSLVSSTACQTLVGPTLLIAHGSTQGGPDISWPSPQYQEIFIDGSYTGQTVELFTYDTTINDSDGVDTVLFRFKWERDDDWLNRSAIRTEGDEYQGRYDGNLTWPAPGGGVFQFKVFANDTLGNWSETSPIRVTFGYLYFPFYYMPQFWLLVISVLTVFPLTLIAASRFRRRDSVYSRGLKRLQVGGIRIPVKLAIAGFLALGTLLLISYTLSTAGELLNAGLGSVQLAYGVLGTCLGLIAVVVLSHIMIQVVRI